MKNTPNNPIQFAVLATDVVILTVRDNELFARYITANCPPHFEGMAGLPGGLLRADETAEEAARRHVQDKACIDSKKLYFEQLYTFSELKRDPRGRVVSVAYIAIVPWESLSPEEQKDTENAWWGRAVSNNKLAYDHNKIISMAVRRLRSRITYTTLISKIILPQFTLTELEHQFESVLGKDIDKRNFRKKILKLDIIKPLNVKRTGLRHRPASLYGFRSKDVHEIEVL